MTKTWLHSSENTTVATLTYSFQYTTSDDIEKAGNRSDMFLTPSLNVKFSKSADISFDKTSCAAASKEIVTWSLDSEANVPVCYLVTRFSRITQFLVACSFKVFSWRSVEDVQTVIIPFLEGVMAIEQAIVDDVSNTNQTAKTESRTKITQLAEAKKGWQGLLDRNWKLYQDARSGKLAKNAVTHLVADALLQDSNGVDNVKYINGTQAPNADALRAISAIRFARLMTRMVLSLVLCLFYLHSFHDQHRTCNAP